VFGHHEVLVIVPAGDGKGTIMHSYAAE